MDTQNNGNATAGLRDWKVLVIVFLLGGGSGTFGHGIVNGDAPTREDYQRMERKLDGIHSTITDLNKTLVATDRRIDRLETYQQYVVKPLAERERNKRAN